MSTTPLPMDTYRHGQVKTSEVSYNTDYADECDSSPVNENSCTKSDALQKNSEPVDMETDEARAGITDKDVDMRVGERLISCLCDFASFLVDNNDVSVNKYSFPGSYRGSNSVQNIFSPILSTSCSPLETFLKEKNISLTSIDSLKSTYYGNRENKEEEMDSRPFIGSSMRMMEKTSERKCKTAKPTLLEMIDNDNPRECSTAYPLKTPSSLTPIGDDFSFLTRIFTEERSYEHKEDFVNDIQVYLSRKNKENVVVDIDTCTNIVKDQEGSRFIQKRLELSTEEEWIWLVKHIRIKELCIDLFGNYVIQKLIENRECHGYITQYLEGCYKEMSVNAFGCRVVQRLLDEDVNEESEYYRRIADELKAHILDLVYDSNGNHVVQKIVERKIDFENVFYNDCIQLSNHKYGCRVLQKLFEKNESSTIINKLIDNCLDLAENQYGNYVLQHIITIKHEYLVRVSDILSPYIFSFSLHKFASNVIEKIIKMCDEKQLNGILDDLLANNSIVKMSMDKYANYVVQRILESKSRERVVNVLMANINELRNCVYSKQIVVKLSKGK
ncbi:Translational repressor Pumilio/PUF3, RNA-binding proteins (Puf superfamily) [Trachipleistophora hominis]|uniref:Translational repressor Pumilio/PUF3, RNA-binding proteins (Puf superfamily) n=1 Tax=Trachipleistophora hominis TaxID=72359 RepID=L7JTE5_TRAHO|nr:Translational repressor Pumilio/PUF3, RNA-binding proteins (Puf superfamily) [Trachipleistophora hominis]